MRFDRYRVRHALLICAYLFACPAYGLEKDIEVDILTTRITGLLKDGKTAEALPLFEKLEGMNVKLPESFDFYYIDTLDKAGNAAKAVERSEAYLKKYGKKAKYYGQVIEIVSRLRDAVEKKRQAEEAAAENKRKAEEAAAERRRAAEAEQTERERWRAADSAGSEASYAAYLKQYPNGMFVNQAQEKMNRVRQDAITKEQQLWRTAQISRNLRQIQGYLASYPNGRYLTEARTLLKRVEQEEEERRPGRVFRDCADCPEMVVIPAGTFVMGGDNTAFERPVRSVQLRAFSIGRTELTQAEWRAIMATDPPDLEFKGCDRCPVESVSLGDVKEYIARLNQKTGQRYRLPTEAEWEYACRAGSKHQYCGSDDLDAVAWHDGNSDRKSHPVGLRQANTWGLSDMSGNVSEMLADCWHDSYNGAPGDGRAWTWDCNGTNLLPNRGGAWSTGQRFARAVARGIVPISGLLARDRYDSLGFRLVRDVQ